MGRNKESARQQTGLVHRGLWVVHVGARSHRKTKPALGLRKPATEDKGLRQAGLKRLKPNLAILHELGLCVGVNHMGYRKHQEVGLKLNV